MQKQNKTKNLKNGSEAVHLLKLKYINQNGFAEERKHFSILEKKKQSFIISSN